MDDFEKRVKSLSTDKRALVEAFLGARGPGETSERYVAPRNEIEQTLAEIWAGVLGVERVGIHDDFFALGGDSIHSIQIVAKSNRAGLAITSSQLFAHPSVERLAAVIEENPRPPGRGGLPLSNAKLRLARRPSERSWLRVAYLELRPGVPRPQVLKAIQALLSRHDALRETVSSSGRALESRLAEADEMKAADVLALPEDPRECDRVVGDHAQRALDLLSRLDGPLIRLTVVESSQEVACGVLLMFHEIVCDQASVEVLLSDLETLIRVPTGRIRREPSPVRYEDAMRVCLEPDDLTHEEHFWVTLAERLSEDRSPSAFGRTPTSPAADSGIERTGRIVLGPLETRRILDSVDSSLDLQVSHIALAASLLALPASMHQAGVLVNVLGSARDLPESGRDLRHTIGNFTFEYPLAMDLAGCETALDVLHRVYGTARKVPSCGRGYEWLRERISAEHGPVAHTMAFGQRRLLPTSRSEVESAANKVLERVDQSRRAPIEVGWVIADGALEIHLRWKLDSRWADSLDTAVSEALRALVAALPLFEPVAATEQFPEAELTPDNLSRVMELLRRERP